jgi:hypothetical protein
MKLGQAAYDLFKVLAITFGMPCLATQPREDSDLITIFSRPAAGNTRLLPSPAWVG